jgi:hypothetical protein
LTMERLSSSSSMSYVEMKIYFLTPECQGEELRLM